jgi:quercetin 2,3-dioxygenase
MIIHKARSRGMANHGWLQSAHSFSFADYYDPERMGFGTLRVINDDTIAPAMGFGTHPHRDMEIITIPLEGSLKHQDSVGNSEIITSGEVQIMSAGTGIRHSEYNASPTEAVKLLQIWVLPKKLMVPPRYEQTFFSEEKRHNKFCLIVSPDGRDSSVSINQDAYFSIAHMDPGIELTYSFYDAKNVLYAFVIEGSIILEGERFETRDGIGIAENKELSIASETASKILLMELPR